MATANTALSETQMAWLRSCCAVLFPRCLICVFNPQVYTHRILHCIPSDPIPSHPIPSDSISSHPIRSHPIPSDSITSHPIPSHPMPSHRHHHPTLPAPSDPTQPLPTRPKTMLSTVLGAYSRSSSTSQRILSASRRPPRRPTLRAARHPRLCCQMAPWPHFGVSRRHERLAE